MRMFLLAVSSAVSVAALAPAANAADIAPTPSVYDWSGVYIGLNAGAAWSNSEVDGDLACSATDGPNGPGATWCEENFGALVDDVRHGVDDSGGVFSGGAMIGANWQWESFVLGVEADVNYADFGESNSSDFIVDDAIWANNYIYAQSDVDANWWGTVRARMGFAADNWLFYGTGGLAWGTIDASARVDVCADPDCNVGFSASGSESDTNVGWTVGAGMEWGWDNWTLGAEYLYVDLGSADFDHRIEQYANAIPPFNAIDGDASVDYQFSVARVTAKWKF